MRIISGSLKGKRILYIRSATTRPLKDSVKENIFNIITHSNLLNISLTDSNILDLYSGVGSFGFECLSRGAKKITFVEKDKKAYEIINKNLINLSIKDRVDVINDEILNFLRNQSEKKYEIFFLDPPYANSTYISELILIKKKGIFKKKHLVIIHRDHKSNDNFKDILNILMIKQYGRSKIIFGKFLN